jgi:hypothetical protein
MNSCLDDPEDSLSVMSSRNGFYAHQRQATRPLVAERPHELLRPLPRISVLAGCRVLARAHLHTDAQQIVVDLEEPRSLRPTIGWPEGAGLYTILHSNF